MARQEIYGLLGGYPQDPTFTHCEDYALWSVWLRFFKPNIIEEALYDYTVSPGSVSVVHEQQQASASHSVNQRFRALGLVRHLPGALAELASIIRGSILDAGILAYRIWRFRLCVRLPPEALEPFDDSSRPSTAGREIRRAAIPAGSGNRDLCVSTRRAASRNQSLVTAPRTQGAQPEFERFRDRQAGEGHWPTLAQCSANE